MQMVHYGRRRCGSNLRFDIKYQITAAGADFADVAQVKTALGALKDDGIEDGSEASSGYL